MEEVFRIQTNGVKLEEGKAYTMDMLRELGLAYDKPRYASTYNISEWRWWGYTEEEIAALCRAEDRRNGYDAPEPKQSIEELDEEPVFGDTFFGGILNG